VLDITETRPGLVTATITRPPANALDSDAIRAIEAGFAGLSRNPPAKGVVLTGAGAMFSAGVDTRAFAGYDAAGRRELARAITRMTAAILALPVPLVGAINGHALGGGLVLALCCDWRIGAEEPAIKLGLLEAAAGVPFPAGPCAILSRELPGSTVRRLALSSEAMAPQAMRDLGVLDDLAAAADLAARAADRAEALARQPGFAIVKRQVRGGLADELQALARSGDEPFWRVDAD